jgi:hypothetical protein
MTVKEAIALFDTAEAEALAVVEAGDRRHLIGLLTGAHARGGAMRMNANRGDASSAANSCPRGIPKRSSATLPREGLTDCTR